ncbi:ABC transporter G family member 20-like isoform X2 [Daphnia pulex]|uniref:ABC transporter G family member 20-like isoform X2 n=1 Tax=Daphnia pulex TaxID=6669 RepID=UPI001EDE4B24|nr:ABC transporter G family member 20-like isoform X2 [Daphnia pulex]
MMGKSVGGSEVIVSTHNVETNNGAGVGQAVLVRNATKSYGAGSNHSAVLKGLDMTVNRGSIYGLLGSSGCGKTTLLSCLVGRRSLNSGEVLILGHEPGTPESGVPGPRVGYMPQELALYSDFTIKETLQYFGRIYNLRAAFVNSQLAFLTKLLDLPASDRYVKTLSGGQQRRVSFAVALFHEPELLILDEPTVGVDPLLRRSIWDHLIRQSVDHGRTVIVTTHYIEEARQANTIGMMRSGRLLAEDSPDKLLAHYNLSSLEDVFLKLCINQGVNKGVEQLEIMANVSLSNETHQIVPRTQQQAGEHENVAFDYSVNEVDLPENDVQRRNRINSNESPVTPVDLSSNARGANNMMNCISETSNTREPTGTASVVKRKRQGHPLKIPSLHRLGALIRKNYLISFRNIGIFVFIYLLPAFQATVFNVTLGHEPKGLKMAIVNEELDPTQGRVCNYTTDCAYSMLSCRYLRYIKDNIVQVPYQSLPDAMEAGRNGQVWGVIHFGHNFTEEFEIRQTEGDSTNVDNIIRSRISVNVDSSNHQIDIFIEKWLLEAFRDFFRDFMKSCQHEPEAGYIPVVFLDPVYGKKDTPFTEFMAPGLIISIVYFMAVSLTAGVFVAERKQGLLDRSLVAGVTMTEIFIGHSFNMFTIIIGQTALVFVCMLLIFNIPCQGNLALAVFITFLQGFVGMCFGLLITTICDNEATALNLSQASFIPLLVMGGICWPIEGMPFYLRNIAYSMPVTYAIESLRSIFARGWGIERPDVYAGILISIAWIISLLVLCLVIIRSRKYTS